MKSNVLIIGHPNPAEVRYGAEFAVDLNQALQREKDNAINTLVISVQQGENDQLFDFLGQLKNPELQILLVTNSMESESLVRANEIHPLFKVLPDFQIDALELSIYQANEKYNFLQQNKDLYTLFTEQNTSLAHLNVTLEEKIQERQKQLEKTQSRLETAQSHSEIINDLLISMQRTSCKEDLEKLIKQSLNTLFPVRSVFIHPQPEAPSHANENNQSFASDLVIDHKVVGHIQIELNRPLTSSEKSLFSQVSEVTALMIDKINKLIESNRVKNQWEKTFNSISDAIALTNKDFQIISANNSFFDKAFKIENPKDVFESFFGVNSQELPKEIYENESYLHSFMADEEEMHFLIKRHKIDLKYTDEFIYLVFIKDITQQKQLENQVLESSKLAELGTIGSSIAHELNNPIGGILSFAQLIKMDMDKEHPHYPDIELVEKSALKCKDIIENLLGFSRSSDHEGAEEYMLADVVERAVKIVELQTKSKNISIEVSQEDKSLHSFGSQNQMVQALCNILQNSIDAFDEENKPQHNIQSCVRIEVKNENKPMITVTDNGPGIEPKVKSKILNPLFSTKNDKNKSGLGLTVAYQIIKSQGGNLEIFSQPKAGTSVRITL